MLSLWILPTHEQGKQQTLTAPLTFQSQQEFLEKETLKQTLTEGRRGKDGIEMKGPHFSDPSLKGQFIQRN